MPKFRIIEDSLGKYRVQYRSCFIWWTEQDYSYASSQDAVFITKDAAEDRIKILIDNIYKYKKVAKIHKVENI